MNWWYWTSTDFRWRPEYLPSRCDTRAYRIFDALWQWTGWFPFESIARRIERNWRGK